MLKLFLRQSTSLENHPESKLNLPGNADRVTYGAKISVGELQLRDPERRMVEGVEELSPELGLHAFVDLVFAEQSEVKVLLSIGSQDVSSGRTVSELRGRSERRFVEPELCTDSLCECGCVRSGLAVVVRW